MNGLLLFDKPKGWTSHDAVDFLRRRLGQRRVGHAGTLDPMATGLLILLAGDATKRSESLMGHDKSYEGAMRLGIETDTYDLEGAVTARSDAASVTAVDVERVFRSFTGELQQAPPPFSAAKVGGRKLYDLARRGVMIKAKPRAVRVDEFTLLGFAEGEAAFRIRCSKGTYVRSLCRDAGRALGCGAAMSALRRTRIGDFRLEDALDEAGVSRLDAAGLERALLPA